jgi:hypothetical protein
VDFRLLSGGYVLTVRKKKQDKAYSPEKHKSNLGGKIMVRTKKAKILAIICTLGMLATMFIVPFTASAASVGVSYSGYQAKTWTTANDGAAIGHANKGLSIEALKVNLTGTLPTGASISYKIYENKGWHSASDGAAVGNANKGYKAEALEVSLTGMPGYTVTYSVYENKGWHTASDGAFVGNANKGYKIEAVEINIVAKATTAATVSAINGTIAIGGQTGFAFKDASGAAVTVDPSTVTWAVADATTGSVSASGIFTAAKAGPASITATIGTTVLTATVNVSAGTPVGIVLSAASSTVVANGTSTDVITAKAVDANGFTVTNFSGSAIIGLSAAIGTLSSTSLSFTNGIASVTYTTPNAVPGTAPTFTTSTLENSLNGLVAQNINYGTLTLTYSTSSATTIGLAPATATVSTDAPTSDVVTVTLEDSTGNTVPSGTSAYVTFTITGPALFAQTGTNTLSAYVPSGSTGYPLTVNSEQGVNGSISITASATGLATATKTISAVTTTAASKIVVTSTTGTLANTLSTRGGVTLPVGTTFTEYTVQLEDANGYSVPGNDALTITDNVKSLGDGGSIGYHAVSSGQPSSHLGYSDANTAASISAALIGGTYSFIVANTAVGTVNPTITVTDGNSTLATTTATATYTYVTSAAAKIALTAPSYAQTVEPGQSIIYSVQEEDVAGNAVSLANQAVTFSVADVTNYTGTGATIDGSTSYVAYTNASGIATVTVAVSSTAVAGSKYTLTATGATIVSQIGTVISSLANYATVVGVTTGGALITWPTTATSGQVLLSGDTVSALNSLNLVASTTDEIQISSSNQAVIATGTGAATETFGPNNLPYALSNSTAMIAKNAGTATITIKDLSNPTAPSMTATITVSAGTPTAVKVINPDSTSGANYTLPSTSGVSGAFTIELVDAGGNVVPATAPLTLTNTQVIAALGASSVGTLGIRTSAAGSDVTSVTFAQGQSSITVYLDSFTASAVTAGGTAPTALSNASIAPLVLTSTWTLTSDVLTITTSNPVTNAVASNFSITGSGATISSVIANGNTITITFTGTPATLSTVSALTTAYGATASIVSQAI